MSTVPTSSSTSVGERSKSFSKAVLSFQYLNKQAATTPGRSVKVGIALKGLECHPHVLFLASNETKIGTRPSQDQPG